jgi:anti-sigma B factor antagonist
VEIQQETLGNIEHLSLKGDLDSYSVNVLKERVNRVFEAGRYNIIIDLAEVAFVDSAGLGQLVAALKMAVHHGGDLILVNPGESVQDLLRITKLDTIFRRFASVEEAMASFPGQS